MIVSFTYHPCHTISHRIQSDLEQCTGSFCSSKTEIVVAGVLPGCTVEPAYSCHGVMQLTTAGPSCTNPVQNALLKASPSL